MLFIDQIKFKFVYKNDLIVFVYFRYYRTTSSAILGAILAIIFLALVILAVLIGKYYLMFLAY